MLASVPPPPPPPRYATLMLFLYWSPPPPLPPPSPVAPLLLLRLVIDVVAKGRLRGLSSVTRKAYRMVFGVSDTTRERERERERESKLHQTLDYRRRHCRRRRRRCFCSSSYCGRRMPTSASSAAYCHSVLLSSKRVAPVIYFHPTPPPNSPTHPAFRFFRPGDHLSIYSVLSPKAIAVTMLVCTHEDLVV